jgi:hypothetical protein
VRFVPSILFWFPILRLRSCTFFYNITSVLRAPPFQPHQRLDVLRDCLRPSSPPQVPTHLRIRPDLEPTGTEMTFTPKGEDRGRVVGSYFTFLSVVTDAGADVGLGGNVELVSEV